MEYTYPDGNKVVFVMFLFHAWTDYEQHLSECGNRIHFEDSLHESLQLRFWHLHDLTMDQINSAQRPVFEDLIKGESSLLRS
ncbi:hypothetical protein BCM02_10522 [Paenibacillus methanolicus]|uniref:Uncharacterized protein n=1 Tax=Paenibacillus methanolicus TaxID=582686 RepID=A0A5S5C798_9BACL|nr:hypothetical protein BCM02_10522 [Paenibacillus methanolicus]